jgi:hypothetical protein
MREGADRDTRPQELVDYDAPNSAGSPGDKHRSRSGSCHYVDVVLDECTERIMTPRPLPAPLS